MASTARRPVNISLNAALVEEARSLAVPVSKACEEGLAAWTKRARDDKWREDNKEAIETYNAWIAENGIPLARYRLW